MTALDCAVFVCGTLLALVLTGLGIYLALTSGAYS